MVSGSAGGGERGSMVGFKGDICYPAVNITQTLTQSRAKRSIHGGRNDRSWLRDKNVDALRNYGT